MKDGRWLLLALGLSLAAQISGCATGPSIQQAALPTGEGQFAEYSAQQFYARGTVLARRRIREDLERGHPDYSPSVQSLNVWPIIPGRRYAFRARLVVIGIAGPSLPLRTLVQGTYDLPTDRLVETRRTPIQR